MDSWEASSREPQVQPYTFNNRFCSIPTRIETYPADGPGRTYVDIVGEHGPGTLTGELLARVCFERMIFIEEYHPRAITDRDYPRIMFRYPMNAVLRGYSGTYMAFSQLLDTGLEGMREALLRFAHIQSWLDKRRYQLRCENTYVSDPSNSADPDSGRSLLLLPA